MAMTDEIGDAANPCRRRILSGLAALFANANLPGGARDSGPPSHDATILYLRQRFDMAASALERTAGRRQSILFRGMSAYAAAMSLIPATQPNAIAAKRRVAAWTLTENEQTLSLPDNLAHDLDASALRDEARQPAG